MNTTDVLIELDNLADMTPTQKKGRLKDLLTDTTFSRVVKFALDPFTTYGINKVPMPQERATLNWHFDENTWVLLEHLASRRFTGGDAIHEVLEEMFRLNNESRELLKRILTKDLRCGVTAKTINSVEPGMIPSFDCQLAHKYEERHIKQWPVAVEPKYDGMRALLILEHSGGQFVSRTGKPYTAVQWLADEIHKWIFVDRNALLTPMSGMVIDGELVDPEGSFYKIGGARGKSEFRDAHFMAFDMLRTLHFKKGHDPSPYTERRMALSIWIEDINHTHVKKAPVWYAGNHDEIMEYYNGVRAEGGEGVIVKPTDGEYHCKRSRGWLKVKDHEEHIIRVDVPIVDVIEGTGKYVGKAGSVVFSYNGVIVKTGGMSDFERAQIWADFTGKNVDHWYKSWEDELDCFIDVKEIVTPSGIPIIGRLFEVIASEKTPDGSLRHPRFVRFRDDKPVEDGVGV
ncbi:DNA ligase [Marinobacter phage PS6]|nr:DNA ligase [Marinobacter phage PS6]